MQDIDGGFLEVLDMYMDMVEKQQDAITKLSQIVKKQACEIVHMRNLYGFIDENTNKNQDVCTAEEILKDIEKENYPDL